MITFNKIVKKLWNKWWKVLFKWDIYDMIDPERKPEYKTQLDKLVYLLRAWGYIIPLKAWVYIVPSQEDRDLNEIDLLEKYFLQLLKKYIREHVGSSYYISGKKALLFHMKDFSIPPRISIVNDVVQKKILVWPYEIHFKVPSGKNSTQKKQKLYPILKKYVVKKDIFWVELKMANIELALIESALVSENSEGIDVQLLTRCIKKYADILDYRVFDEVWVWKYNMAFNRLKELSKSLAPELYETCLWVIKKNGWCFAWEGLRNL